MPVNPWITYVKKYAKKHHMGYTQALKKAGPSYKKNKAKKGGARKRKKKKHY